MQTRQQEKFPKGIAVNKGLTYNILFVTFMAMEEEVKPSIRGYELSYLISDAAEAERISEVLTAHGSDISVKGQAVNVRLAYPIKKQLSAWFGFVYFRALPEVAEKISEALKVQPSVLRFLLTASPKETLSYEARKPRVPEPKPEAAVIQPALTNEALEQKLEEILK